MNVPVHVCATIEHNGPEYIGALRDGGSRDWTLCL